MRTSAARLKMLIAALLAYGWRLVPDGTDWQVLIPADPARGFALLAGKPGGGVGEGTLKVFCRYAGWKRLPSVEAQAVARAAIQRHGSPADQKSVEIVAIEEATAPVEYTLIIERAGEGYSGWVPDLPGCIATGRTHKDVERLLRRAAAAFVEELYRNKLPIPKPKTAASSVVINLPTDGGK
ncbi:MAG: type II toxin-antitoxin system HicB family antitoxin [bacterium]